MDDPVCQCHPARILPGATSSPSTHDKPPVLHQLSNPLEARYRPATTFWPEYHPVQVRGNIHLDLRRRTILRRNWKHDHPRHKHRYETKYVSIQEGHAKLIDVGTHNSNSYSAQKILLCQTVPPSRSRGSRRLLRHRSSHDDTHNA